jgi:ATP-dependent 26S proteasome regulatory subunit
MTSNHPETLDGALTRAGRMDRKFYIDYARDEELRSFHSRIAEHYRVQPWPEFRAALPERTTIADAQALAFQGGNYDAASHAAMDRDGFRTGCGVAGASAGGRR